MGGRKRSTGDAQRDMENREALVEGSLDQLFGTYDAALEENAADPVIVLLDCEDEIGHRMAVEWVGEDEVDEAIAEQHAGDDPELTTTLALWLPYAEARDVIARMFPYLAPTFKSPPPRHGFLVVAVASGGAATFTVPFDARSD